MARPTKLTSAVQKAILDALAVGATRTAAFQAAGVHHSKIAPWLARFAAFRGAVELAEAQAELRATITVRQSLESDWKAAAWWLERRRRDDWGKTDRVEIEIKRAAERIASATGADPDWLVRRAVEIVAHEMARDA